MDYTITALILVIMWFGRDIVMRKKIKLPKWIDYTMLAIAASLTARLVYLAILS
jgi:hypothetical protein